MGTAGRRSKGEGDDAGPPAAVGALVLEIHRNAMLPADLPSPEADLEGIPTDADVAARRIPRRNRYRAPAVQIFGTDPVKAPGALVHVGAGLDNLLQRERRQRSVRSRSTTPVSLPHLDPLSLPHSTPSA